MTIEDVKLKLQELVDIDQAGRSESPIDWVKMEQIDRADTEFLKGVIDEYGWPSISQFGENASHNAWLLAQHADWTPDIQAGFLDAIMKLPVGEVKKGHIAYLTDRVMLKRYGIQRYGTQLIKLKGKDYYILQPLENKAELNNLRKEMELEPIEDHLSHSKWDDEGGAYIDEADYLEKNNSKPVSV